MIGAPLSSRFQPVDTLMRQALAERVFPGAVLLAGRADEIRFHAAYGVADIDDGRPVTIDTLFDLASLTKPLATTLAVMRLEADGRLDRRTPVAELLPAFRDKPAAAVTVAQLLRHTSGLPAWAPFSETLRDLPTAERRSAFERLLCRTPLERPAGTATVYSDLGFMILAWIVRSVSGQGLDRFAAEQIYRPLDVAPLYFVDRSRPIPPADYAATERCPWRGKLVGQVHDDNCWTLGGVCGHAGLFGTAAAVHRLLACIREAEQGGKAARVLPAALVGAYLEAGRGEGERAFGFDVPSADPPACGRRFSAATVGHLGFTGTSFWLDRTRGIDVVLLTNRVHPGRANEAIRSFRPVVHDAVMAAMGE